MLYQPEMRNQHIGQQFVATEVTTMLEAQFKADREWMRKNWQQVVLDRRGTTLARLNLERDAAGSSVSRVNN